MRLLGRGSKRPDARHKTVGVKGDGKVVLMFSHLDAEVLQVPADRVGRIGAGGRRGPGAGTARRICARRAAAQLVALTVALALALAPAVAVALAVPLADPVALALARARALSLLCQAPA